MRFRRYAALLVLASAGWTAACEPPQPESREQAEVDKDVEEAFDRAGEAIEDAGRAVGDAVETGAREAAQTTGEALEEAGEEIQKKVDEPR